MDIDHHNRDGSLKEGNIIARLLPTTDTAQLSVVAVVVVVAVAQQHHRQA